MPFLYSPDHFVKAFDHLSRPGIALSRAGRAIEPSLDAQLPAQSNAPGSQKKKCQQRHFHAAPAALHRRCGSHMGSYAFAESLNLWSLSDWSQATTLRTYHLAVIPSVAFTESLGAEAGRQVHSSGLCARLYLILGSLRRPWRLTRKNQSGLPTLTLRVCSLRIFKQILICKLFGTAGLLCQKLGALEGYTTFHRCKPLRGVSVSHHVFHGRSKAARPGVVPHLLERSGATAEECAKSDMSWVEIAGLLYTS